MTKSTSDAASAAFSSASAMAAEKETDRTLGAVQPVPLDEPGLLQENLHLVQHPVDLSVVDVSAVLANHRENFVIGHDA